MSKNEIHLQTAALTVCCVSFLFALLNEFITFTLAMSYRLRALALRSGDVSSHHSLLTPSVLYFSLTELFNQIEGNFYVERKEIKHVLLCFTTERKEICKYEQSLVNSY